MNILEAYVMNWTPPSHTVFPEGNHGYNSPHIKHILIYKYKTMYIKPLVSDLPPTTMIMGFTV